MSIIQPDTITTIATSVDIPKLSDDAARMLAPDVEYRLREVVQEALKFAKHAKRTKITTEDINNALQLRNVEPLYGFGSKDPAKFLRVATHPELMYVRDPELSFNELIEHPLPKLPRDAGVTAHWLCIEGVQPDVPENVAVEAPPAKRRHVWAAAAAAGARMGALQDAAAAGMESALQAAIAAGAGDAAAAGRLGGQAGAPAGGQQHQQQQALGLAGAAAGSGVGVTPRGAASAAVQLQVPVRHSVSRELQVYFDRIVGLILAAPGGGPVAAAAAAAAGGGGASSAWAGLPVAPGGGGSGAAAQADSKQAALLRGAFSSLAVDPGLHPLVPYFSSFIADGVRQHLASLAVLHRLLQLARALLANPGVHLAPYLQQLLPAVVTCVVTKTLGASPTEDHWAVRREAASLLAAIAAAFAAPHHNLTPRLCRVLAQAWLDADKPLPSKYGAVVGLQALGPQVVRTLLIPHLEPFMTATLLPAMQPAPAGAGSPDAANGPDGQAPAVQQQQQGLLGLHQPHLLQQRRRQQQQRQQQQRQQQQQQAWQVYGAVVSAVGGAVYDLLVGQVRGRLPLQVVLARTGTAASAQEPTWEEQYTRTLLAARRMGGAEPQRARRQQQQQQQQQQQVKQEPAGAAPATGAAGGDAARQPAGCSTRRGLNGAPAAALEGGRSGGGGGSQQPSAAEVLGRSWREDSDVNATLGALLGLFGEDLLPCLPLPHLASVTL